MLNNSIFSQFSKNRWFFTYANADFDDILKQIMINADYDYIELRIWSAELYLLSNMEYVSIFNDNQFSTVKMNKSDCIKILEPTLYENIRLFKMKMFSDEQLLFDISSDNYGEYTSIAVGKTISKDQMDHILNSIKK